MEENEIIELSTDIVEGLTQLALGAEPGMFSGKVIKSLRNHPNLEELKSLLTNHITNFKGIYETAEELKVLSDFRYNLVTAYNQPTNN